MTDKPSLPSFLHNKYSMSAGKSGAREDAPCHREIRRREWEGEFSLENVPGIGMLWVSYLSESSWKPCKTHACLTVQMSKGWLSRNSSYLDGHKCPSVHATQMPVGTIASGPTHSLWPCPQKPGLSPCLSPSGRRHSQSLAPLSLFLRAARSQLLLQDPDTSERL